MRWHTSCDMPVLRMHDMRQLGQLRNAVNRSALMVACVRANHNQAQTRGCLLQQQFQAGVCAQDWSCLADG